MSVRRHGARPSCQEPARAEEVRVPVAIVDGWADVGSSNLDHRSLGLDDEINTAVRDTDVVG